jgi:hypothetical protein
MEAMFSVPSLMREQVFYLPSGEGEIIKIRKILSNNLRRFKLAP